MKKEAKEIFLKGVKNAFEEFEKKASFQNWMRNDGFKNRIKDKIIGLTNKVKG